MSRSGQLLWSALIGALTGCATTSESSKPPTASTSEPPSGASTESPSHEVPSDAGTPGHPEAAAKRDRPAMPQHPIAIYGGPTAPMLYPVVGFADGSAKLTPQHDEFLDTAATLLIHNPDWRIAVEGHADSSEGKRAQKLSELRAAAVRDALLQRHVAPERMIVAGFAGKRPIDTSETPEGRNHNRRVEFRLIENDRGTN